MNIFTKFSLQSRKKKLEMFYKTFSPDEKTLILDVGAESSPNVSGGLQLIDLYQWKKNYTAINLSKSHIEKIAALYPEVEARVEDACNLPFPDKYFDVVYSNAVIEHLGSLENQMKMANEIQRVAKNWFVTTPNKAFPYEFHMRLPFVSWFSQKVYLKINSIISYNHVKKKYTSGNKRTDLRLMTKKEIIRCFSASRIYKQRITFFPETIIVIGGDVL